MSAARWDRYPDRAGARRAAARALHPDRGGDPASFAAALAAIDAHYGRPRPPHRHRRCRQTHIRAPLRLLISRLRIRPPHRRRYIEI